MPYYYYSLNLLIIIRVKNYLIYQEISEKARVSWEDPRSATQGREGQSRREPTSHYKGGFYSEYNEGLLSLKVRNIVAGLLKRICLDNVLKKNKYVRKQKIKSEEQL